MYGDGEGLYLRVGPTGAKSWILRTTIRGRLTSTGKPLRWEGGLGSTKLVSLAEAREKAHELRKVARNGGDPSILRSGDVLTFAQAAKQVYEINAPTWKNEKHKQTWLASLESYVFPTIGNRDITTIESADVLQVLSPIWVEKNETAKRIKQRIGAIFDWAKGSQVYHHENPINGLKKALPRVVRKPKRMAALPWQEVPGFMASLQDREGVSARALEFIILTACRSGEARGAMWSEIEADCWTVPGGRMKRGLEHRVPLSCYAENVLEQVKGLDDRFCFPSSVIARGGAVRPLSVMVFKSLFNRLGVDGITVHGFRSSFRDWASESAHAPREVAEAALAHSSGNEVERAYARSDLFERRRGLMDSWGQFCSGEVGAVVRLQR